ncbi:DsrE family protein [Lewinella sp. JB7]|uniref:DsrE family protein n=1 Tax=Lewinella sp. JB7 TaxID=2962887 RepID=UPI0020C95EA2|nr:DsrE family protein [Lewinella sp. JB7]MCP9236934.1 DsrE family protein [Lewinella sp. JB7]
MRFLLFLVLLAPALAAQQKVTPAVPFGGIYDVPEATVRPDTSLTYNFVVDVVTGSEEPDSLGEGLYRVARMVNLFAVGGIPAEKVDVVLAIHGGATVGVMDNASYRERFGVDNPNIPLIRALKEAGVRVTVCGQSLLGRGVPTEAVLPEVEIATSMLTTVAMYQMRGYGVMQF